MTLHLVGVYSAVSRYSNTMKCSQLPPVSEPGDQGVNGTKSECGEKDNQELMERKVNQD